MQHTQTPQRSLLKKLLPLIIIGIALAVAAVLVVTKPDAKPVEVKEKAWLVDVELVRPQALSPGLTLYGQVESLWSSPLTAGVAADVVEVLVIEGDHFAQGELLLRLDERDARLRLLQREAELKEVEARIQSELTRHATHVEALPREKRLLALTRNEVNRLQGLVSKQVSAQSQLDTARLAAERQAISLAAREQSISEHKPRMAELEAGLAKAEALRDQAALELERCTVYAPFNGRVARLLVSPGRRVRVGDQLLEVYDTDALVVRAQLPNRALPTVRAALAGGTQLSVRGSIDGQSVTARLRSLAGEVSKGSGGVEGLFEIEGDSDILQQGRFVRLELTLPQVPGLVALPHEAIYGTDRIYRMDDDNRMRSVRVERVGEARDGGGNSRVLVRSPELVNGARVITTQLPNAIDGLLVRVAADS